MFLLAWLLTPLLLCALSLGCGLLVASIAERTGAPGAEPFPAVLVVPTGFALVVVLASLLTNWELTAPLTGVGPLLVAVVGLVIGRQRLRRGFVQVRSAVWPLVAAVVPAGAVAAPVVLTLKPGMSGYGKITDLGHQISFIEYLRTSGRAPMHQTMSSFDEVIAKLIGSYPGGTQSVVATMADLAHINVAWAYQPVLAYVAAMLGLALYAVLGRAIASAPLRAIAAGVAAQPTILYAYTLAAGIKELSGAAAIVLVAAIFASRRPGNWSVVVPGAIAIGSAYSIFSVTILPWIGVIFLVLAIWELLGEPRDRLQTVGRWAGAWALAAVITAPAVADGVELYKASGSEGPQGLGNLAAPVPSWSAVGPWITADHRFPLSKYGSPTATYILIGVALALAVVGVVHAVRTRDRGVVALTAAGAVALAYILRNSGVWVQLKAFCMTAPITLSLAFAGAAWIVRRFRARALVAVVGLGAACAVGVGVLYGNALQYHNTPLLPYDRMTELEDLDTRFAGQGPALLPNFDDLAEYFMRDSRGSGLIDPWRSRMVYNRTATPGLQTVRDTDEYDQRFLQEFPLIIRRRDPTISRPPSDYRRVAVTRWYEVWKRVGDPRQIEAHFPLKARPGERTRRFCERVQASVDKAGDGARIAYARPPDVAAMVALPRAVPPFWGRVGDDLLAGTPGRLAQDFGIPNSGTYRVWMRGSVGRKVEIAIDGRKVGALRWRESYPGQYEPVTTMRLTRGTHHIEIVRGGGNLLPGTGNDASGFTTIIGPVVFDPTFQHETIRTAPASALADLCRSDVRLDWLEVLRPGTRPVPSDGG